MKPQPVSGIPVEGWKPELQKFDPIRVSEIADPLDRTKRINVWPGPVYCEGQTLIDVIEHLVHKFNRCKTIADAGNEEWFPAYRSACADAGRLIAFYGPRIIEALANYPNSSG